MGGKSKREQPKQAGGEPIEASAGGLPGASGQRTMPAFMPGMKGLLAEQLAAGYGGADVGGLLGGEQATPGAMAGYLDQVYSPTSYNAYSNPGDIPQAEGGGGERKRSPNAAPLNPEPGQRWVHRAPGRETLMEWDGRSWRNIAERRVS